VALMWAGNCPSSSPDMKASNATPWFPAKPVGRSRISPSWLFVLPAFLLGVAMERGSSTAQPPGPVGAPAEVHYSPGQDLESMDVALIGKATKQVDMAAYVLTDNAVIEALRKATERGVKVRIFATRTWLRKLATLMWRRNSVHGLRASSFGQIRRAVN
jgi:phosphatidylserine/phosphatidylglycerophosphate/cardiolipin synthase-like enzyme